MTDHSLLRLLENEEPTPLLSLTFADEDQLLVCLHPPSPADFLKGNIIVSWSIATGRCVYEATIPEIKGIAGSPHSTLITFDTTARAGSGILSLETGQIAHIGKLRQGAPTVLIGDGFEALHNYNGTLSLWDLHPMLEDREPVAIIRGRSQAPRGMSTTPVVSIQSMKLVAALTRATP